MNRYDFAFVMCRCVSLFFVGFFVQHLAAVVGGILIALLGPSLAPVGEWWLYAYAIVPPASAGLIAMLFWFLAPSIARRMVPKSESDEPPMALDHDALLSVALTFLGVYLCIDAISGLVTMISDNGLITMGARIGEAVAHLMVGGAGFCLLITARGAGRLVRHLRTAGVRHADDLPPADP